jgi:hypothetical protein
MKINWLDRQVQPDGPNLVLCLSEKEYNAVLKHLKAQDISPWLAKGVDGVVHTFKNGQKTVCAVCTEEQEDIVDAFSILVHEAVHVWQDYKEGIGETNPGVEQEAYGIQYIATTLIQEYKRRTKETK